MPTMPTVEDVVQRAGFVFVGTVEVFGTATEPDVEIRAGTAVVRVNRVLRVPQSVGDLTGSRITVQLKDPPSVKVGEEAIFYAAGVVYGKSIVVQEVSAPQVVAGAAKAEHVARVTAAVEKLPDLQIQVHAADADLVIVGRITEIRPVASAMVLPVTHHDPLWHEAVVQVESVEAGTLPQKTISILFSASYDVAWHKAPKLQVGQEGAFFLHKQEVNKKEAYVVLHPLDFHPRGKVERIRALLKGKAST
jgi:hypothetical protein